MIKKQIYFNEYNLPTGDSIYFPYSSGLLQAYVQQYDFIKDNFEFQPVLFHRDTVDNILKNYDNPSVAGFSVSLWNHQLSLAVAKEVKKKFPKCLVVFGGPSAPLDSTKFLADYPFVDLVVYKEGEKVFKSILNQWLEYPCVTYKDALWWTEATKNLDEFPSPYVTGVFDNIIEDNPNTEFKAIMETTRGCPFTCAYCFWGESNITKKIGFHSLEYLQREAKWFGQHKIKYIMCCDANFGMYKQDLEIAKMYSKVKEQYGYPEKFRVDYGKNTTDNIFETAMELKRSGLIKTVTMSLQTNTQDVLSSIGRKNIKKEAFQNLQKRYIDNGVPTYTEIILGLPSETKQSFLNGLDETINIIKDNQLFIYHCILLPNTKLNTQEYRDKYQLKTVTIPLAEGHGNLRNKDWVQEYEEIVIGTSTLTTEEWIECAVISWVIQLFHSLKIGYDIVEYLVNTYQISPTDFYNYIVNNMEDDTITSFWYIAKSISSGGERCECVPQYGPIYYEPEELALLNILQKKELFYITLVRTIKEYCDNNGLVYENNIHTIIEQTKQKLPNPTDFSNLEEFAKYTILYGRKSNTINVNQN